MQVIEQKMQVIFRICNSTNKKYKSLSKKKCKSSTKKYKSSTTEMHVIDKRNASYRSKNANHLPKKCKLCNRHGLVGTVLAY